MGESRGFGADHGEVIPFECQSRPLTGDKIAGVTGPRMWGAYASSQRHGQKFALVKVQPRSLVPSYKTVEAAERHA